VTAPAGSRVRSPSRTDTFHGRLKGDLRKDGRAGSGLRFHGKPAAHHLQSFLHADESEAATTVGAALVKANSHVTYRQLNLSRGRVQFHPDVPYATVFHCVLQGLLQDPE